MSFVKMIQRAVVVRERSMFTKINIDRNRIISKVEAELFGALVEHVGRSVYNGIYEPFHATSNEQGFRKDVIECVKEMKVSCIRYPGGNFVSAYDWKDGIGKNRKARLSLAWKELEPNNVGIDEMMKWTSLIDAEIIMATNMGTGTPKDSAELIEYCNFEGNSYWANERRNNGSPEPYRIKYWCIGNEMDGGYEIGAMSAMDYAKKANETAKEMKIVDENARFIMCGSSSPWSQTCPVWDKTVLENTYKYIDFISVHAYYDYIDKNNVLDFLASPQGFDNHIKKIISVCDSIKESLNSDKTVMLAVDEWNVWHTDVGEKHEHSWVTGEKLIENDYDFADALVVGGMISVLVNNADRVKIACIAQLVNVIAPIMTRTGGAILKQTTYYPFEMFTEVKGLTALKLESEKQTYLSPTYGESPYLYKTICYDKDRDSYICIFVNVADQGYEIELAFENNVVAVSNSIITADLDAKNTFEQPANVLPRKLSISNETSKMHKITVPKHSISKIKFKGVE